MPSKRKRRRSGRKRHRQQHNRPSNILEPHQVNLEAQNTEEPNSSLTVDCEALVAGMQQLTVSDSALHDDFFILGEGSFGLVTMGHLKKSDGKRVRVAIKQAHNSSYEHLIMHEAEVLSQLDHPNVVKVLAIQQSPPKIALEYMGLGDILDALKLCHFTKLDLLNALHEIAAGMEYIAQKQYVHMDLACRNVFVNDKRQCKIGDFGLSQYVGDSGGVFTAQRDKIQNRICAPEVAQTRKFTTKSDVWSMGLVIWEIYFGAYQDAPIYFKRIILESFLMFNDLSLLPKPTLCPAYLYSYMRCLLDEDPNRRPTFSEVKQKLISILRITEQLLLLPLSN